MDIAVSTSPAATFMLRKHNTWYTTRDGNWNDPNIWMSNSFDRRNITTPQFGDDVYINHSVDYNNTLAGNYLFNNTVGNLFISGTLTCNSTAALNQCRLFIVGNLLCTGTIDFNISFNPIYLHLLGTTNTIANLNCGTQSSIIYNSAYDQIIAPVTYCSLELAGGGKKILINDLMVTDIRAGAGLIIDGGANLDLSYYNANISQTILIGNLLKTSSSGVVNFNGSVYYLGGGGILFSGVSPTVNFYGGVSLGAADMRGGFNLGSGTVNVMSTQNWMMNTAGNQPISPGNCSIIIASGKTLTITAPTGNIGGMLLNGTCTINGASGTSALNIAGGFFYGNTSTIMATGLFNHNSSGISNIGIYSGVTMNVPFDTFFDFTNYGIASLTANTTITNNLNVYGGTLQLETFDFFVGNNLSNLQGAINKSGPGTVTFSGNISYSGGAIVFTSNPTVNLGGSISGDVRGGFSFGSGIVNIINSVTWSLNVAANIAPTISFNILIAAGKTLINNGLNATIGPAFGGINTTGTINGVDSTSVFDNRSVLTYNNATAPMITGKLFANQLAGNTVIYGSTGNQDIALPQDSIPGYQNLILQGAGVKKLLGNTSVKNIYTLSSPATLNTNGYSLTNP